MTFILGLETDLTMGVLSRCSLVSRENSSHGLQQEQIPEKGVWQMAVVFRFYL